MPDTVSEHSIKIKIKNLVEDIEISVILFSSQTAAINILVHPSLKGIGITIGKQKQIFPIPMNQTMYSL